MKYPHSSLLMINRKVRQLQARLALYEPQTHDGEHVDAQRSTTAASDPTQTGNVDGGILFNAPVDAERRDLMTSPLANMTSRTESAPQRMETHFTLGSSQNFGSRIQDLLERQTNHSSRMSCTPQGQAPRFTPNGEGLFPEPRMPLKTRQGQEGSMSANLHLPPVAEAYELLDTVLLYLGDAQHYFDPRDLSDQLMVFYRNTFDEVQRTSIWYLHILLVFAIGKVLRGDLDGGAGPPGFAFFNEAVRLLPDISEIRAHGVAGIEILALLAVYCQNIDRKDDAASHVRRQNPHSTYHPS